MREGKEREGEVVLNFVSRENKTTVGLQRFSGFMGYPNPNKRRCGDVRKNIKSKVSVQKSALDCLNAVHSRENKSRPAWFQDATFIIIR